MDPNELVQLYIQAMECQDKETLLDLFAEDAAYIEPFAGSPQTHQGKGEIRAWMDLQPEFRPDDLRITLDKLDVEQDKATADWTCISSVFPAPMRGRDFYTIRDGKIARLETTMLPPGE